MKKLFTSFAIAALCSISANAQNLQRNTPANQNAQDISPVNVPAPIVPTATDQKQPTTPNARNNNPRANQARDNNPQILHMHIRLDKNSRQQLQEDLKQKPLNQNDGSQINRNEGEQFRDNAKNMNPEERQRAMKSYEEKREAKIDARQEKLQNLSPEEKTRMEKRQEMMSKLSSQQRDNLKKEQERHRQEVKKITGFDMEPNQNNSGERK
jgi:hypothetical protein